MSTYLRDCIAFAAAILLGAIIIGLGAAADLNGWFVR